MTWLLYGANGYTGELIAREAVARNHKPILAGRARDPIEKLAGELALPFRIFDLEDHDAIARELRDIDLILLAAGPFSRTSGPVIRAALDSRTHYVDITGEIAVFEAIMARDTEAKVAGVTLLPGAGFDVVPTDCLAAMLAAQLPAATELWLAFYSQRGSISRGTMKTMIEGIGNQGAIRKDGRIVQVPMLFDVRTIPFSCGDRLAMTIPWGDVSTAFHSTGIPNIRVYSGASPRSVKRLRMIQPLIPLLRLRPVKRLLQKFAGLRTGPDAETRASAHVFLWGRVSDPNGGEVTRTMSTPEGYSFTAAAAVRAVERILAEPVQSGSFTPSKRFGAEFVKEIPGVEPNA